MINRYNANEIDKLADILDNDGVISVPTDTVFGLCAKITSKTAHDKLVKIKNRPTNKSFPVMCSDLNQIKSIAKVNKTGEALIKSFMPGPITLVLYKNDNLPDYVTNGKETIAIRMATSAEIKCLIDKINSPIFMTSANQSGKPECTSLDDIEESCPLIDGMLKGSLIYDKSSTIVDCCSDKIKILRNGPISECQLISVLSL